MRKMSYFSFAVLSGLFVILGNSNATTRSIGIGANQHENTGNDQTPNLRGTCIWQELKAATTTGDQQGVGPATVLASLYFDGSGRLSMNSDTGIYDFRMSPNGHTIYTMAESDGVGSVAQRVSVGTCSFQE